METAVNKITSSQPARDKDKRHSRAPRKQRSTLLADLKAVYDSVSLSHRQIIRETLTRKAAECELVA
jgi:hypothetical protein